MKTHVKQILSMILVGLICSVLIPSGSWAIDNPQSESAPLNPAFVEYQAELESGQIRTDSTDGYPTCHIPSLLARYNQDETLTMDVTSLPATYDLRLTGRITPIRNQTPLVVAGLLPLWPLWNLTSKEKKVSIFRKIT